MQVAVSNLSPVNIQTRTPALRRSSRDSRTLYWSLEIKMDRLENLHFPKNYDFKKFKYKVSK